MRAQLNGSSTATVASQLQRRGIRNMFLSGLRPTRPGTRLLGYAFTLRYVPMREDLQARLGGGVNAQRRAVEGIGPEEVLVIEARGEPDAGTIGPPRSPCTAPSPWMTGPSPGRASHTLLSYIDARARTGVPEGYSSAQSAR